MIKAVAYAIICLCLLAVLVKVLFMFLIPYERHEYNRSVSLMPLVECIPLLIAIAIAYSISSRGVLAPRSLALLGFGAIIASWIHLVLWIVIAR